jgi:hypothetical protein
MILGVVATSSVFTVAGAVASSLVAHLVVAGETQPAAHKVNG